MRPAGKLNIINEVPHADRLRPGPRAFQYFPQRGTGDDFLQPLDPCLRLI
jgi:hypothetical protein